MRRLKARWLKWRSKARAAISDSADSETAHLKHSEPAVDPKTARRVIDLVMRVCELAISTGASCFEATSMGLRLATHYRIPVIIDITNTSVLVAQPATLESDPVTGLRTVSKRYSNYTRLADLEILVDEIMTGSLAIEEARARFDQVVEARRVYRPLVVNLGNGLMGAGIAVLLGGQFAEAAIAGAATATADRANGWMAGKGVSLFFVKAMAAAIPTAVAIAVMWLRSLTGVGLSPSFVVAGGLVSLLAALQVVSAARDLVDGFYITAGARTLEALVATSGIVLGVIGVLWIGLLTGPPGDISPTVQAKPTAWWLAAISSGVVALGFAIWGLVRPRAAVVCGALGVLAWGGSALAGLVSAYPPLAAGFGAFAVGLAAELLHKKLRVPVVALVMAGVAPLLPGLMLYRGIFATLEHQASPNVATGGEALLLTAFLVGIALAMGASLGGLVAHPLVLPADALSRLIVLQVRKRGVAPAREDNEPTGLDTLTPPDPEG